MTYLSTFLVQVFHAGTRTDEKGKVETTGGRVLTVTGVGSTLTDAVHNAYSAVSQIEFSLGIGSGRGKGVRRGVMYRSGTYACSAISCVCNYKSFSCLSVHYSTVHA